MGKYLINDTTLTAIADAIRANTGKTENLTLNQCIDALDNIKTGTKYIWERKTQKTTTTTTNFTLSGTRSDYAQEVYITVNPTTTITAVDIGGFVLTNTANSKSTLTLAADGTAIFESWGTSVFETYWSYYPEYGCVALSDGEISGSYTGTKQVTRTDTSTSMVSDGYVLSDDPNAYPVDGSQHTDGYYYTFVAESE